MVQLVGLPGLHEQKAGARSEENSEAAVVTLAWCVPHSGRILSVIRCPLNSSGRCLSAQQGLGV